jgi:hypothetical protein
VLIQKCDICKRELSPATLALGNFHFCENHAEHAEAYIKEIHEIMAQGYQAISKNVERNRNRFLHTLASSKLKAVK